MGKMATKTPNGTILANARYDQTGLTKARGPMMEKSWLADA
jgi:hypothetical protein